MSKYGCGPLYDQVCASMDGDAPVPGFIIAMALRNALAPLAGNDDDDGALAGHDH